MVVNPNYKPFYPGGDSTNPPRSSIIDYPQDIQNIIQEATLGESIEYSLIHYFMLLVGFKRALEIVKV